MMWCARIAIAYGRIPKGWGGVVKIETVRFGIGDVNSAWAIARARNEKEAIYGGMNYAPEKESGLKPHMVGIVGELAVSRYLGLPYDARIFARSGDDGVDLLSKKLKIQVKSTTYTRDPWLRVECHLPPCDIYVLTAVKLPALDKLDAVVTLVGYATHAMVMMAPQKILRKNGPRNYVLTSGQLVPLSNLKAIIQNEELP